MGHADFIAKAPNGTEVEELSKKEINQALRGKIPAEEYEAGSPRREQSAERVERVQSQPNRQPVDIPQEVKEKSLSLINEIIGTRGAFLVNDKFEIVGKIPYKEVEAAILNIEDIFMIVLDGVITDEIAKSAEQSEVKYVIGSRVSGSSSTVKLASYEDIGYTYR